MVMGAWQQADRGTAVAAKRSHLELQTGKENKLSKPSKPTPSDLLHPTRPHLLNLKKGPPAEDQALKCQLPVPIQTPAAGKQPTN